jgi:hypothetical protein
VIEGDVRNVRQLKRGWQADVIVGETSTELLTVQVITNSPEVLKAAQALKRAIQVDAARRLEQASDAGSRWAKAISA